MNYTRRIDTDKAVEMQISSFTGKGGTTEYQVMVSITDPCCLSWSNCKTFCGFM